MIIYNELFPLVRLKANSSHLRPSKLCFHGVYGNTCRFVMTGLRCKAKGYGCTRSVVVYELGTNDVKSNWVVGVNFICRLGRFVKQSYTVSIDMVPATMCEDISASDANH